MTVAEGLMKVSVDVRQEPGAVLPLDMVLNMTSSSSLTAFCNRLRSPRRCPGKSLLIMPPKLLYEYIG